MGTDQVTHLGTAPGTQCQNQDSAPWWGQLELVLPNPQGPILHPVVWGISPRTHTFGPEGTMEYLQVDDSFPEYQLGKTLPVIFKHPPLPGDAWEVKGDATAMVSFL